MANLTEILKIAGTLENAETMARDLSARDPQFLLDLELVLSARGKIEESKILIDELHRKQPNDNRIAFNRGWHVLHAGDLQEGIEMLDRGRFEKVFGSPALTDKPIWNGGDATGKKILLRSEGGLGDEIINVRFAADIAKKGGEVIVSCNESLLDIFLRVPGVSKVVRHEDLKPYIYDEWLPAMSAPRITGHTYRTLSGKSYISALESKIKEWKKTVTAPEGVLKVGIRWSGNPQFEHEQFRRFPVEPLFELAHIPGVKLFSLQRDNDLKKLPENIVDLGPKLKTWDDTAGAIENLDLVITSCTSIAHFSAALGKETWVIVPIMPYYIWAPPGEKNPWYDSAMLFRQTKEGVWHEPFENIKKRLLVRVGKPIMNSTSMNPFTTTSQNSLSKNEKTLHFMAGLPRSGSTMLASMLAQNPDIAGAPVSGLCGIINGVSSNWDKIEFHQETPNEIAKVNTLRAILQGYHQDKTKPIVIDKDRFWVKFIALLEKVMSRKIKIIVMVRPVVEILASFETLRQKDPLVFNPADELLGPKSTLATRCQYYMDDNGVVGSCYNILKDAVISGFRDRMLFVDYNKLMQNPERDLKRIYEFLELPYFKHDLNAIAQLVNTKDVQRLPGLHQVRSTFERKSIDPLTILGPELTAVYSRSEPWEQWT